MDFVSFPWPSTSDDMCPVGPISWPGAWASFVRPDRYDADLLRAVAPRYVTNKAKGESQRKIIDAIGRVLTETLTQYSMNIDLRAAHFIAQTCEESDGFATTEEYASGSAYEGRDDLGNTQEGDGVRYKGRGLIQLTGRGNYASYGKLLGLDLVNAPTLAAEPVTSLLIACEFWKQNRLNAYADQDDILSISKLINTGHIGNTMPNGLSARKTYLAKAKAALGLPGPQSAPTASFGRLKRNDVGAAVLSLQKRLTAAGYAVSMDGQFGTSTETAVKR